MGERIRHHIRSNVVGYVAVFLALSGGAYAIDGPLPGQDQVGSADIINNEVQSADIRDANLTTADIRSGAVTTGKIADGEVRSADVLNETLTSEDVLDDSLTGADIAPDAVGPGEIQNPFRGVNLPLTSFVNSEDSAPLDFTSSDGTSPDLRMSGTDLVIEWDDDSDGDGPNVADTDLVQTTFTVPQDYSGGARYVLHASKDANTGGVGEFLNCQASAEPDPFQSGDDQDINSTEAILGYTLFPFASEAAGTSVNLRCWVQSNFPLNRANDVVNLHSVEFRYLATQ